MMHGDRDGYRVVYDDNGQLILHPNERKLVAEENVIPTLKSTWRYYGGDHLLEPSKGTMFLTNERLVFINTPERMFAIGGSEEARAMESAPDKAFEIGEGSQGGSVREYFEVPNMEIMASERKEGAVSVGEMVNVYIMSSGNQFHLSMVLPKESGLLSRLMNKKVQSLDELVNNLKELFKQTEWMYTEQERRLMVASTPSPSATPAQTSSKQPPKPVPNIPGFRVPPAGPKPMDAQSSAGASDSRPYSEERSGRQSLLYFENLFKKGLIKEDIYLKLISQFKEQGKGHAPSVNRPSDSLERPIVKGSSGTSRTNGKGGHHELEDLEVPMAGDLEVLSPEATPDHPDKSDDELLSMLNNTLSDLGEEPVPDATGSTTNGTNGTKPLVRRVLRTAVKREPGQ